MNLYFYSYENKFLIAIVYFVEIEKLLARGWIRWKRFIKEVKFTDLRGRFYILVE